jgi:hypothetical protein
MKNLSLAIIVLILLIGLVFEAQPFVDANPTYPHPVDPFIIFSSPQNKSYNTNSLGLNVSVGTFTFGQCPGEIYKVTYSLDGQDYVSIPLVYKGIFSDNSMPHSLYIGAINLPLLPDGNHSIEVHCLFEIGTYILNSDNTVIFTIDKLPPHILVLTVENKTYKTADLPLNFTVNEETPQLTYSLDGQDNVTIAGNTTLSGLPKGDHILTIYAKDEAGNMGASETIYFSVEPFPTTLVVASVITVSVAGIALFVYFKKRKR